MASLAAVSLAFVPFVGGGAGSLPLAGTAMQEPFGATGELPAQRELGPQILADAGDPLALARGGAPLGVPVPELADGTGASGASATGSLGIPGAVLKAYYDAERALASLSPGCKLDWSLLAAIGRIESGHASGGRVDGDGRTLSPILGPQLNGAGAFAAIADTDGGALDGDGVWDRAVGPMQFIPGTWRVYAADGNGDGVADPHNVFDATVAAGKYLCAGGGDLSNPQDRARAVFRYNQSDSYVRTVLLWASLYAGGVTPTASASGPIVLADGGPVAGFQGPPRGRSAPPPPAPSVRPGPAPSTPPATGAPPATGGPGTSTPDRPDQPELPGTTTPPPGTSDPTTPTTPPTTPDDPGTTTPPPTCEPTEPPATTEPTEPTATEPTEPPPATEPTETAEPTETTEPTDTTEPPPPSCTP
ncbi:lytic transglycosylase domain-containing protein [Prauserella flavalba]|uniref:lytic transglycosylase domain-containing protein n=1 Tax=Prauserella flavalba TaxID=1477506 RepID=UPI0036E78121